MEEETKSKGFQIADGKIPILLALKRVEEMRPHEDLVQEDLNGLVGALQRDPTLRHPIIADSVSGAVLDGTHRLAALKQLDCRTVPAALIDYQNPLVKVERWFRMMKGESIQEFVKQIGKLSPLPESVSEAEENLLARSNYATIRDSQHCFALKAETTAPLSLTREAFALEQVARSHHMTITYTDNADLKSQPESTILMSTIRLEKDEIIKSCRRHELFPPKSTRHLIPSRPLGITVPLQWLHESKVDKAEKEFEKHLAGMKVKRLAEGSVVGSRRYMEEVFLFE